MDIKSVNADKEWLELLDVFSKRDLRNVLRNAASRTGRSVKDVAVCGSLYMVGHIREIILAEDNTFIHRKVSDLHTPEGNTEA